MEDQKQTSYMFEIDNFSEKESVISSPKFLSGGCEWFLKVYPKGELGFDDHLALYLCVANPQSLRLGWKRRATFSFLLLNQPGKDLYKTTESCPLFCAQVPSWGSAKAVASVTRLLAKHPGFAVNLKPKSQLVKTTYMNLLLGLIQTLEKPPHSLSETELSNARSELIDLTEGGFKLDWLKTKLDEVSMGRKKSIAELEEQVMNLKAELNKEKVKSATSAAKVLSLEKTLSDIINLNKKRKLSPN
ncbi:unnamed protein product [Thlaspi arvense]|uniref:MATH domain-containing protein n=1 Tax=Thlaspi arvense TaxID=13288 RepID=A0AAU9RTA9_THLAR|nr:unnamed protein product [Thlaspi arvense]